MSKSRIIRGRSDSRVEGTHRFPVSVKGVVVNAGKIVLLKNERDEWELPGGKLEPGETPERCLVREIAEELGVSVNIAALLDSWVYRVAPSVDVLILTYGVYALDNAALSRSNEHKELGQFTLTEIGSLPMPEGYKASVRSWMARKL